MGVPDWQVKAARYRGKLGCGHWARKGETIGKVHGRWVCTECLAAYTRAALAGKFPSADRQD